MKHSVTSPPQDSQEMHLSIKLTLFSRSESYKQPHKLHGLIYYDDKIIYYSIL